MGCRILYDREQKTAVLYCSTSGWAFGPLFHDTDEREGDERAEAFTRWLRQSGYAPTADDLNASGRVIGYRCDPRALTDRGLERAFSAWLRQETEQAEREGSAA